jgi:putative NADH-flavin reductase
MNILLIGATGAIGSRILNEAISRGHEVTAVARHVQSLTDGEHLKVVQADAKDVRNLARLAAGHDAVVSSLSPRADGGHEQYLEAIRAVLAAVKRASVPYVLFVGGAASLEVEPGVKFLDVLAKQLSKEQMAEPVTVMEARDVILASDVNWAFLSPAGQIFPGERTGRFRLGGTQAVRDAEGQGRISMEDYAIAVVDELERPQHARKQFNVGY